MRIRYMLAIAGAVVGIPVVAHSLQKPGGDQLADTLREYGFIPRSPPTTLMTVGSLYYVDSEGKHFSPICIADKEDIGEALRSSPSVELQQSLERKGQLATGISIDIGWLLRGNANNNYAVKVNYSLTDVRVEEIPLGTNWQIFGKLMDQPHCNKTAMELTRAGGYVCQVTSILTATAEFKLDRDAQSKLDTSANATADDVKGIVKLAVESQGNQDVVDREGRLLAGKALQYGAVLSPECVAPRHSRFRRVVPSTTLGRFWNYVLFNILEPILPAKDEPSA
ncbi:hypothetical protein IVB30_21785 [Bradyrhizobium sp. 200]|uniref:hypothetical protein n=1 Tax=Bradyrhizobium sp. 200 TaxID=2782665 RepID=UPI00200053A3|nr:hypothetical protein [Bradyrhizobium sp. 200]UPJ53707.1 hypothetical protein IVB30_21785 [Bradyrhizobium sp. 200]